MKKYAVLLSLFFAMPLWADQSLEPLLNKVTLQLNAEQWVTTQSALVNVVVNAGVSGQGIEKIQNDVLAQLNKLSDKGSWHILSYDRSQDKSGLENIQMTAQARLPQTALTNLRDIAKNMSKPGATYTIDSVQFTPSEDEVRLANTQLRNNLYLQAKAEVDALNKLYPDQKYFIHQVNFNANMPMPEMSIMSMAKMGNAAAPAAPLNVGSKQQMQAMVALASMQDVIAQKLATHNP